ncbi:type VII toxin-antitoxin system HepT family RNase toxin [Tepidimonas sp.]|uniref:type VII toxin-antitoxin system HepT family RNase toxin n=1 Tax=Tepidimonas sp. TaxID=2002775 RepID=UPI002FE3F5B9
MRLDLYQAETERIAAEQAAVLDEARRILASGRPMTRLEDNGLLHALQVLIENAIGKAKQWLKAQGRVVPVSAYDAFAALADAGFIDAEDLPRWNALVGVRNRIVHDYMNIDRDRIHELVRQEADRFVLAFLLRRGGLVSTG